MASPMGGTKDECARRAKATCVGRRFGGAFARQHALHGQLFSQSITFCSSVLATFDLKIYFIFFAKICFLNFNFSKVRFPLNLLNDNVEFVFISGHRSNHSEVFEGHSRI